MPSRDDILVFVAQVVLQQSKNEFDFTTANYFAQTLKEVMQIIF